MTFKRVKRIFSKFVDSFVYVYIYKCSNKFMCFDFFFCIQQFGVFIIQNNGVHCNINSSYPNKKIVKVYKKVQYFFF